MWIPALSNLLYHDNLPIPVFTNRWLRDDLIHIYRLLFNHYKIDFNEILELNKDVRLWGHKFKLWKENFKTSVQQHFFPNRLFSHWNGLPSSIITTPSVSVFKNQLDQWVSLRSQCKCANHTEFIPSVDKGLFCLCCGVTHVNEDLRLIYICYAFIDVLYNYCLLGHYRLCLEQTQQSSNSYISKNEKKI